MSLIRRKPAQIEQSEDEELCTLKEAAQILKLNESTIRRRLAGTQHLAHVRQGHPGSKKPRLMLLRSEVLAHRHQLISDAREQQERINELAYGSKDVIKYLAGDHPTLTKAEIKEMIRPYKIKEGSKE